ncbi:MAG: GNAT family N-acetyltransferase [Bacilli bacterium]|jgi:N-acetylglutamate synthase-like GNAT family acetyltransferase|nr:GNAT family N-acetyltransferase [Bacilli bacterium]MDD4303195.1 GNAT family N-acetyltransferase [Bacilli bacterium]NCA94836.1 N-acetyltransferase [Campylobacterota bacterium]HPY38540.1 GNAT family N-acetyltransferase [Bacilli bacterium]
MKQNVEYIKIREHSIYVSKAAAWFSRKWNIPEEAYLESMKEMLKESSAVPQWYIAFYKDTIVGGIGVIANDFHNRPDLSPNLCALFVEPAYRRQGIAGQLLSLAEEDMKTHGISTLYLLTDHDSFYEKYGWTLFAYVKSDGEEKLSRMYMKKLPS